MEQVFSEIFFHENKNSFRQFEYTPPFSNKTSHAETRRLNDHFLCFVHVAKHDREGLELKSISGELGTVASF